VEKFFIEAAKNFANSLGLEINECKEEVKQGYVSKIEISGDLNYDVYLLVPGKVLSKVSFIFFCEEECDIEDMTNEIANLIVGNAKVLAKEDGVSFNISTPTFLGDGKIDYDKRLDLALDDECFAILFKER